MFHIKFYSYENNHTKKNEKIHLEENASSGFTLMKQVNSETKPLAMFVNGTLCDLGSPLKDKDEVEFLYFDDPRGKALFWHSSAHVLAQAVKRLYPEAQPTIGPPIEEGFFYDFAQLQLGEDDFSKIEKEIEKILKEDHKPKRIEYASIKDAKEAFRSNPYKQEIIENAEETLSAYEQGEFVDLCTGPHLPNFRYIKAFKLTKISGAYWRGDAKNEQLLRIYAISFPQKAMMQEYLTRIEEAKKRDHRVLGKKLGLFSFQEQGVGMPFFHPKGWTLFNQLVDFIRFSQGKYDYLEIKTPTMLSQELWQQSGHWDNYKENMYITNIDDKEYAIKPMNCPGCMLFYKSNQYSYRDLPLRIAEIGNVHRYELTGALTGLFRARSFHQDDAHVFMEEESIQDEIYKILELGDFIYNTFGLEYHTELSTRPDKSIGTDEEWEKSTNALRHALEKFNKPFYIKEGDGAFYGPKIDFHIRDAIGRTWQCGTLQLDMSLPARFDLTYIDSQGVKQRPVMIHRAIFGSIERFLAILIEHFTAKFPLWLSPVQIKLIPMAERHLVHAREITQSLQEQKFRVETDLSTETLNKRVRNAQQLGVNYILVVGDSEVDKNVYSLRNRENKLIKGLTLESIQKILNQEVVEHSLTNCF